MPSPRIDGRQSPLRHSGVLFDVDIDRAYGAVLLRV